VLAAVLRWLQLGEWSLWIDEAHTWRDATMPLAGEHGFLRQDRALYPITFLALRGLLALGWIGSEEAALRLPFAVVGVLSVAAVGMFGRRLVGPWAAVMAAWLCALHPWHVYWSQNARGYILALLFATLAIHRAACWAHSGRSRDLLACWFAIGVGSLCHPTTAMLATGLLVYSWLARLPRLEWRHLWVLATAALLVAWFLPLALAEWSPIQGFLSAKKGDPSLLHLLQTTAYYYRPLVLLFAVAGWWALWWQGRRQQAMLLGCLAVMPFFVLLAVGGSLVKTTARYSIVAMPVLLWLAAVALEQVALALAALCRRPDQPGLRPWRAQVATWVAAALLAADLLLPLVGYYRERAGDRGDWREACAEAQRRAGERGLRVVTIGYPIVVYYLQRDLWEVGHAASQANVHVQDLSRWGLTGMVESQEQPVHPPGGRAHLAWHAACAAKMDYQLAILVTLPELAEKDDGELLPTLWRDYDLVQHWPRFVGPKDESIYLFMPRD
jgi:mannosyltransferase